MARIDFKVGLQHGIPPQTRALGAWLGVKLVMDVVLGARVVSGGVIRLPSSDSQFMKKSAGNPVAVPVCWICHSASRASMVELSRASC